MCTPYSWFVERFAWLLLAMNVGRTNGPTDTVNASERTVVELGWKASTSRNDRPNQRQATAWRIYIQEVECLKPRANRGSAVVRSCPEPLCWDHRDRVEGHFA